MPVYEYVCLGCDLKFELLLRLSQAGEKVSCPRCHNDAEQVPSTFCSFSKDQSGLATSLAGNNSCSSCSAASCDSCGL